MKKFAIILGVVIIGAIGAGFIAFSSISKNLETLAKTEIGSVDLSMAKDGVYEGRFDSMPIKVVVQVEIIDRRISDIRIVEHKNGKGKAGEGVVERIIAEQKVDVDAVGGATYSSKAITLAVKRAILGN
jgi:uncharacterized protein with FMN-binding domain